MNIMQDNNDKWLEQMLAEPPEIADDGFSSGIINILNQKKERRRFILGIAYLLGFLLVLALTPWINFTPWLDVTSTMIKDVTFTEAGLKEIMTIGWNPLVLILMPIAFFFAFLQREFE